MASKNKKFADDGWAVWVDGEDTSTIYINEWLNPRGSSYVDLGIRIRGVTATNTLFVFVPFSIDKSEMDDVSLLFHDKNILQATFSATCIADFKKNAHTSEIAYNGKTIDIVHISTIDFQLSPLSNGTLMKVDLAAIRDFLDNDEAYFVWRMPHKSLDEVFRSRVNVGSTMERLRDLITSPVISEKYGYSVRINESRLLPEEIGRMSGFHRQKLKKTVVTISLNDSYEINDSNCYRIRRLEEKLYKDYVPSGYDCDDVITYQWNQSRAEDLRGHFNFYFDIAKNAVSKSSMFVYLVILFVMGLMGDALWDLIASLLGI